MGEELAKELEGLGSDLDKSGSKLGKDFAKKFGKDWTKNFNNGNGWNFQTPDANGSDNDTSDSDSDSNDNSDADADADADADTNDVAMPDTVDPSDMAAATADLGNLGLKPAQRAEIARIGAESEKAVAAAQERLEGLSSELHDTLANPAATEAEVSAFIDQIAAQESTIRKARILGWVKARHVLDDQQRARVEKRTH
jgi:Spy/CpxP family protein refolding chaperone